jgi:hypothetical protein
MGSSRKQECVLVGDITQLPPAVFSDNARDRHNYLINAFSTQAKFPLIARLIERGWPVWRQPEILRACSGAFDLPSVVSYDNGSTISPMCDLALEHNQHRFHLAMAIGNWLQNQNKKRLNGHGAKETFNPPPDGKVWGAMINVQHSFAFQQPGEYSRGNTAMVN